MPGLIRLQFCMDATQLSADLKSSDPSVRTSAAEQLTHLEEGAQAAAVPLVRAMNDAESTVRDWAYAALELLGPPAASDGPALAQLLSDPCLDIAYWAATLLGRLGAEDSSACAASVKPLIAALESYPESAVRECAAWALGQIGPPAAEATAALQTAAAGSLPRLSRLAKEALEKIKSA